MFSQRCSCVKPIITQSQKREIKWVKRWLWPDKEIKQKIKETPALEKALIQKIIYSEMEKSIIGKILRPMMPRSQEWVSGLVIYEMLAAQSNRPEWRGASLEPHFSTWFRLCCMYLWMVEFRTRYIPEYWKKQRILRHSIDYFWQDIDESLVGVLGTNNPLIISKYSKMHVNMWFGSCLGFDSAVIDGDIALAEALWRNLYTSNPDISIQELLKMVEYIRSEQFRLSTISNEKILTGDWIWTDPPFVAPPTPLKSSSKEMEAPFSTDIKSQMQAAEVVQLNLDIERLLKKDNLTGEEIPKENWDKIFEAMRKKEKITSLLEFTKDLKNIKEQQK